LLFNRTFAKTIKSIDLKNFEQLGIQADFVKGLNELGIETPTEIQEQVIPLLLEKTTDLIAQANTGTGKTAGYGLPLLHKIDPKRDEVQGLILCPTRELSQQVAKQLFRYTKYTQKMFAEAVYGGEYIGKQISRLQRPTHVVVATPGRLIDLVKKDAVDLKKVRYVILDEADEMLSMGFQSELEQILKYTSSAKSKWLFSATMPTGVVHIAKKYMSADAVKIKANQDSSVNKNIEHCYTFCNKNEKLKVALDFLKTEGDSRGIVFCKTKASAQRFAKQLHAKNIAADALHGDLTQMERDKVMRAFKNERLRLIVATDVAARGLHIDNLAFVIHYELPDNSEYYVHRSGRTGRAGKEGLSFCLIAPSEIDIIRRYEDVLDVEFNTYS